MQHISRIIIIMFLCLRCLSEIEIQMARSLVRSRYVYKIK